MKVFGPERHRHVSAGFTLNLLLILNLDELDRIGICSDSVTGGFGQTCWSPHMLGVSRLDSAQLRPQVKAPLLASTLLV